MLFTWVEHWRPGCWILVEPQLILAKAFCDRFGACRREKNRLKWGKNRQKQQKTQRKLWKSRFFD